MNIKGTVTPDIAMMISGYDFDVRTVRSNVNLHFNNGHATTDLVCYKLGSNKYEVEVIDDPLHLFRDNLEEGDMMNTSEIANVMIRQALKENDMKYTDLDSAAKRKKSKYNGKAVTGSEDGNLTTPSLDCGAIASSLGMLVHQDSDFETVIQSVNCKPEDVISVGEWFFIPNSKFIKNNLTDTYETVLKVGKNNYEDFVSIIRLLKRMNAANISLATNMSNKFRFVLDLDVAFMNDFHDYGSIQYNLRDRTFSWNPYGGDIPALNIGYDSAINVIIGAYRHVSKLEIAKTLPEYRGKI